MSLKPGDTLDLQFTTRSPSSGAATAADTTPTATLVHNGVDDGAVTLTITNPSGAIYKISGTIPSSGYVAGDVVQVRISATVSSVSDEALIGPFVLDSKRVGDLQDVSLSAMEANLATAAALASLQTHGDSTWATATGFATTSQASSLLTAINNLNNLSALANLFGPSAMVPPASGTLAFDYAFVVRDSEGNLVAADATPTVTATNLAAQIKGLTGSRGSDPTRDAGGETVAQAKARAAATYLPNCRTEAA
jgi:hypothetical protein